MDLKDYIAAYLNAIDSDLDVRDNSPYSDLFIVPQVYLGAAFLESLSYITNAALPNMTDYTFNSVELEALAKKVFLVKQPPKRSYGTIRLYMSSLDDIDLTNATFSTKDGTTIYPSNTTYISSTQLENTDYGFMVQFVGYCDDGTNISANAIVTSNLTGWSKIENDAFTSGSVGTTDDELAELYYNSYIYQDNFLYARSIMNLIKKNYPDVTDIYVAGKNEPEMRRDFILDLAALGNLSPIKDFRPNNIDVSFSYTPYIGIANDDVYDSSVFVSSLTTDELNSISSLGEGGYEFTRGKLAQLNHMKFTEYTGHEYDDSNLPGTLSIGPTSKTYEEGNSSIHLSSSNKSSKYVYSDPLQITSLNEKSIYFTVQLSGIGDRYMYMLLSPTQDNPAYYSGLGVVFKESSESDEYNVFLTDHMITASGDIVLGDVSMNMGDNMSDVNSPSNKFGRPYLAATHVDIAGTELLKYHLKITKNTNDTSESYTLELIDTDNPATPILKYTAFRDVDFAAYDRITFGVSDAKTAEDGSFDIELKDLFVQYNDMSDGYGLAFLEKIYFKEDDYSEFYTNLNISIDTGQLTADLLDAKLYIVAHDETSGEDTYKYLNCPAVPSAGSTRMLFSYTDSTHSLMDIQNALGYVPIILAWGNATTVPIDNLDVTFSFSGYHSGNYLDVYINSAPKYKIDSGIASDSNGNISINDLSSPILYLDYVSSGETPVVVNGIFPINESEPEIDYNYRYSAKEGEHLVINTVHANATNLTVSYYTNEYVQLLQALADDDYYRDPVQDILIRSYIPVAITNVVVSVNAGYTINNAENDLKDYVNSHGTSININDMESIFLNDGAKSASITSLAYTVYYPDYSEQTILSPVPSMIDTESITTSGPSGFNIKNKAFMIFDNNFDLSINGV